MVIYGFIFPILLFVSVCAIFVCACLFLCVFCINLMYDASAGKTMLTLTNHKKSVRAMAPHPKEYVSISVDCYLWSDKICFLLFLLSLNMLFFCLLTLFSFLLAAGKLLHLHRLIILRNSTFQKENFCTICCEFNYLLLLNLCE